MELINLMRAFSRKIGEFIFILNIFSFIDPGLAAHRGHHGLGLAHRHDQAGVSPLSGGVSYLGLGGGTHME